MATNTMVALATYTIPSTQASYTFTGISTAYTDLQLVVNGSLVSSGRIDLLVGNSSVDTTATYSNTELLGNGSTPNSYRNTGTSTMQGIFDAVGTGTGVFQFTANFMSYANTNTYRTILGRYGAAGSGVGAMAGTWRNNTQAINTIQVLPTSSFAAGTTLSLYGIAAQPIAAAKATGGSITYAADGYTYHAFTSSGTFTPSSNLVADILVLAGGGGGGAGVGGGGGAGGIVSYTGQSLSNGTGYSTIIGSGGAGFNGSGGIGTQGGSSTFGSLSSAIGGGYGAYTSTPTGGNGGSGGGGADATGTGGSSTSGQGNNGGNNTIGTTGAGGGGAGGTGFSATVGTSGGNGGNGGVGTNAYVQWLNATGLGVNGYIAGGGGGGGHSTSSTLNSGGTGGLGGGGTGGNYSNSTSARAVPTVGQANTGSGGGGDGWFAQAGKAGGSGLIIVRYPSI